MSERFAVMTTQCGRQYLTEMSSERVSFGQAPACAPLTFYEAEANARVTELDLMGIKAEVVPVTSRALQWTPIVGRFGR